MLFTHIKPREGPPRTPHYFLSFSLLHILNDLPVWSIAQRPAATSSLPILCVFYFNAPFSIYTNINTNILLSRFLPYIHSIHTHTQFISVSPSHFHNILSHTLFYTRTTRINLSFAFIFNTANIIPSLTTLKKKNKK